MAKGQTPENAIPEPDRLAALELAAAVGPKAASEHLGISRASVYRWMNLYPQQWSDMRAGDPEANKRGIARRLEDLADRYGEAEHQLLDRVEETLIGNADAKEAAALIKAMGGSRQTATVGARATMGETEVHEHNINFPAIERAMELILKQGAEQPALQVENEA